MIITPKLRSDLWKNIPGTPNCIGKDIAPEKIFMQELSLCIWDDDYLKLPDLRELTPQDNYWRFWSNQNYLALLPKMKVPNNVMLVVRPRSTLSPRLGFLLSTPASIDPGFEGKARVLLYSFHNVKIAAGTPLFSLEMRKVEEAQPYNGRYQETNINQDKRHSYL